MHRVFRQQRLLRTKGTFIATIYPTIDTFTNETNPTSAPANQVTMTARTSAGNNQNLLLKFNLSVYAGWTAESADLVLHNVSNPASDRTFEVYLMHADNADWTPSANYNTRDGTNPWAGGALGCGVAGQDYDSQAAGGASFTGSSGANQAITFPLDPDVVTAGAGDGELHLVGRSTGAATGAFQFHTNEATDPAMRPYLRVRFILVAPVIQSEAISFPSAVGYGRFACVGHEDWPIIEVTNLNNGGAGSLRAAIVTEGPRTIVPRVAGTITLTTPLTITEPNCAILGHLAPGGGLCLKSGHNDFAIGIRTNNVLLSGLKFRPGVGLTNIAGPPTFRWGDAVDGIASSPNPDIVYNIYIRGCSFSFSVDELLDLYRAKLVTVDNCLLSLPLELATHSYTATLEPIGQIGHAKHLLMANTGSRDGTIYRCVFAHGVDRHPEVGLSSGYLDMVNNVIYNWGTDDGQFGGRAWVTLLKAQYGNYGANIVGNYYKPGPDSANRQRIRYEHDAGNAGDTLTLYLSGNTDTSLGAISSITHGDPTGSTIVASGSPVGDAAYGTPLSAADAYTELITNARVGDWYWLDENGGRVVRSDDLDLEVIGNVADGDGAIISSETETVVGGWPTLDAGTMWTDSDHDGIPDAWAAANPGASKLDFWWG